MIRFIESDARPEPLVLEPDVGVQEQGVLEFQQVVYEIVETYIFGIDIGNKVLIVDIYAAL